MAISALLTLPAADALHFSHPIYAFIAAIIVTDLSPRISRRLGLTRIAATVIGASVGVVLNATLGPGMLSIGLGVFCAMLACQAFGVSEGAKVASYIAGLILIDHLGDAWTYALDRFLETLLGVSVAWAVSLVPRLIRYDQIDPSP